MKIDDFAPKVLLPDWRQERAPFRGWSVAYSHVSGLLVIMSVDDYDDPEIGVWLHVSVSHRDRLPTWEELKIVKNIFMGDRLAIQILPPKKFWLNIHNYTLHMQSRLDRDTIPEMVWKQTDSDE